MSPAHVLALLQRERVMKINIARSQTLGTETSTTKVDLPDIQRTIGVSLLDIQNTTEVGLPNIQSTETVSVAAASSVSLSIR